MQITKNLGRADRLLRLIAGLVLIGLTASGTIGIWGWIGVILLATSALNFCPLYRIIGIKTCTTC